MHYTFTFKRHCLLAAILLCLFTAAQGQDFWSNGVRYQMTSHNTAEVIYASYYYDYWDYRSYYNTDETYSGDIVIPSQVSAWVYPMYSGEEAYEVEVTVTGIGTHAFDGCSELTSVTLPNTLQYIDSYAFLGCTSLKSIDLPEGLEVLGYSAFQESGLESIVLPSSITEMDWNVFYGCESMTDVTVPEGFAELPGTFMFCTALKRVTLPNTLLSLSSTFKGCSQLESIELPGSLTSISDDAFYNCDMLSTITSRPETPPSVSNINCFYSLDDFIYTQAYLRVPSASLDAYRTAEVWKNFVNIVAISEDVAQGDVDGDGRLSIGDVTALIDIILARGTIEDYPLADVDGNGNISIADVTTIIDMLLEN